MAFPSNPSDGQKSLQGSVTYVYVASTGTWDIWDPNQEAPDMSGENILAQLVTVDGAGSGLDADLLDGQTGSYYTGYTDTAVANLVNAAPGTLDTLNELAAALGDDPNFATTVTNSIATKLPLSGGTMTGKVRFNSSDMIEANSGDQSQLEVYQDTVGADAFMAFHVGGDYAAYFGLDGSTNDFSVGGWSMGSNKYKVWHAGNDGSGSGLDADTVDGLQASQFLRSDTDDTSSGIISAPRFSGTIATSGDGKNNIPFRLASDYSSYMVTAAGDTWGLFWAGNSGAYYGTNGAGGPGNIWGNSGNPNEFVFVGGNSTRWTVHGDTGHTWQAGNLIAVGNITAGGDVISNSDIRLKSDIKPINNPIEIVQALNGKAYIKDDRASIGLIAQEVEEVLPQLVHTAEDEMGTKSVAYGNIVAVLIEAVKDQQKQIEELKQKLENN
jgi:hypothetical protein